MLIRRSAALLTPLLLAGLTPPLTGTARADTPGWGLQMARDFIAAEKINRGRSVTIALLSDGVASNVKGLRGSLKKEKDLVNTPRPKQVLGTLMASVIAGGAPPGNLPVNFHGLAPAAKILPVRVYATTHEPGGRHWQDTAHWGRNIADGIRYAVDHGADVIAVEPYSMEDEAMTGLRTAVAYAQTKNVVVVAPMSVRKHGDFPPYPVSAPGVIGVGTATAKGERDQTFTSRSSAVLISAPGVTLPSIGPDGQIWTFRGYPVALTFVTAAAAMIRSEYPKLTPAQVGQALSTSARRPNRKRRYDTDLGFGYLNAIGALTQARALAGKNTPTITAPSSVPEKTSLGGHRPATLRAAPYHPLKIGGFGALALAGLIALALAVWLALPQRPTPPPAPTEPPRSADTAMA